VTITRQTIRRATTSIRVVVLVLHGGTENGNRPVRRFRLAYLRMVPFWWHIGSVGRGAGAEVRFLRNRVRGWNAPDEDPVVDARDALRRIHEQHPGIPVVLVGHSMGGRAALTVADDPAVTAVCALAPWTPPEMPIEPITGCDVLIVHGTEDSTTNPDASYHYARRAAPLAAGVTRIEVRGSGHAMLRRARRWHRMVAWFVLRVLGRVTPDRARWKDRAAAGSGRLRVRV